MNFDTTSRHRWFRLARLLAGLALIFGVIGRTPDLLAAPKSSKKATAGVVAQETVDAMRLLRDECFLCHGEEKKKGGLSFSTRESALRGADDGPVIEPGQPDASPLLKSIVTGADPHMPPKKQLKDGQIQVLRNWIRAGAIWDRQALTNDLGIIAPVTLAPLPANYRPVVALAMAPEGRHLAVGRGGNLSVLDLASTNAAVPVSSREAHLDSIQSLSWSHCGQWLASGGFRQITLTSAGAGDPVTVVTKGLTGRITALGFSPDGKSLAAGDSEAGRVGWIRLIDTTTAQVTTSWRAHGDTVFALQYSRDGTRLATAGGDRLIRIWDTSSGRELAALEGHTAQVTAVAFNTNATQVVSGGLDKQLKVWDIATREKIIALGNPTAAVTAVAWPGDGSAIFATTEAGSVFRYTNLKSHTGEQSSATADERLIGTLPDAALSLAVSADGKRIAAGGHDGLLQWWNAEGTSLGKQPPPPPSAEAPLAKAPVAKAPAPDKKGLLNRSTPPVSAQPVSPAAKLKSVEVESLKIDPAEILLSADAPQHGILVTAVTRDGFALDVTDLAKYQPGRKAPFFVNATHQIRATAPGGGELVIHFAGHEARVRVVVQAAGASSRTTESGGSALELQPPGTSFVRDVLPALNRAGCAAGACHAKADGQNGFKLSVFSYDTLHDYGSIVKAARGRRVFPSAPDESLLLQKPLTTVPHEGGQRFEAGSATHQLLMRWLREGMPYVQTNEPALERLTVFPKERRYRKGATQRLLVEAHYADGSVRDVTSLAGFAENDREMATVNEHGRMVIGRLTGQGVVVARYMGLVADSQILVPADHLLPESQYAALPRNNFIDEHAFAQHRRLGLFPSDLCTDAEFLRRAKLDALGLLPTPEEVRAFLADPAPDKRHRFIEGLLDDPAYADYWANKWADLVRPNPDRVGVKSVYVLDQWLRERFAANQPYDQFAREILLEEGSNHRDGPAVIYRDRREPPELTTLFSQLFLGTRLECAKCHHHPNEKWSQDDFFQMAAFFGGVKQKGAGLSPPISAGTETFYFASGGSVKHPVSGRVMAPRPPDGPEVKVAEGADPRTALADWLTARENPFFARAAVNRVWANFFGRGLVEPVDDFRISNPCVNPELLDALARDFASHGYDFKQLIRTLLESRLYQLSTTPNDSNLADTRCFSRAYRRRLPAEVLLDAVNQATGIPDTLAATPPGLRAMQTWSYKIGSHFLDAFGRPNSSSDCPCERDRQMSVVQSLHLMNARTIQAKLEDPTGKVQLLAGSTRSPAEIVTELYQLLLSRFPNEDESRTATAAFTAPAATRAQATVDVFWALMNSPEFVLNH